MLVLWAEGQKMRRREFIQLVGGTAIAWPLAAGAQQTGKVYRIGFLGNDPTIPTTAAGRAFLGALRDNGFIDGQNILVDWRFAEGRGDQYADLATAFVRLKMDLIVASSSPAARAAKDATKSVPIVMLNIPDPLGLGLVSSLASPEGNMTGLAQDISTAIAAKRLGLLKDAVPELTQVTVLINPDDRYAVAQWNVLQLAAQSLNIKLRAIGARQAPEIPNAFDDMKREHPDALFLTNNGLYLTYRKQIVELALNVRLPTMSNFRESTEVGGLMSYGTNRAESFRSAAIYVAKILKGAKPSDLPVEQPTKFELVINLKTATTLGLTISRDLLLLADEVIE